MARRWLVACGDALETLRKMPDRSAHMAMTSPPYYGLRSNKETERVWDGDSKHEHVWGPKTSGQFCSCGAWRGQLGLEPSPALYIEHLVQVLREVKRVLRDDGTLFLNLGSSYAGSGRGPTGWNGIQRAEQRQGFVGGVDDPFGPRRNKTDAPDGFKAKDLIPTPWLVGLALQQEGWYLRNDIIWAKPNPMPSSVTDRFTAAHEYVLLFSKSRRYYFDIDAIREPQATLGERHSGKSGYREGHPSKGGLNHRELHPRGKNKRDVWTISTKPSHFEHYATYPEALVEPCIKAGTSEFGCCPRCGAPFIRIVERVAGEMNTKEGRQQQIRSNGAQTGGTERVTLGKTEKVRRMTKGWKPGCQCYPEGSALQPAIVLDPFGGLMTTGVVAVKLGRSFVGIDLSSEFCSEGRRRLLLAEAQSLGATLSAQR